MYEDNNNGFEQEENNETNVTAENGQNEDLHRYEYRYNYQEASRWQSDASKYNSQAASSQPEQKTEKSESKPRRKWWIPVIIGMAVLLAAIAVGTIFGVRAISRLISQPGAAEQITENITGIQSGSEEGHGVVINQAETVVSDNNNTSSGSVVLTDVSDIVDEVMPSVVAITSRSLVNSGSYWGFFNFGMGGQGGQTQEVESGAGTGTIVGQNEEELLILTSYHVVQGSSSFYVTFVDDSTAEGYIKAVSEEDDIAVVAILLDDIEDSTLNTIKIAKINGGDVKIGEGVIVIGNALGYGQSVTTGIISALNREISLTTGATVTTLQTNADINSGNSGGALLNARGELIGISEAKVNDSKVEGMCYAISIQYYYDKIIDMLSQPVSTDTAKSDDEDTSQAAQGAYLGIYGYDITSQLANSYGLSEGVYIINIIEGSGADKAGLAQGDIITGIDGKEITTMTALKSALAGYKPGDKVTLSILKYDEDKGYEQMEVEVVLTAQMG